MIGLNNMDSKDALVVFEGTKIIESDFRMLQFFPPNRKTIYNS